MTDAKAAGSSTRRRKTNAILLAIVGVIAVVIAVSFIVDATRSDFDTFAAASASADQVPRYQVLSERSRSQAFDATGAELLVPNGTEQQARAAIADYLTSSSERELVSVSVVDEPDAGTVTCDATYVTDDQAAVTMTGEGSDSYPALRMTCF